MHELDGTDTKRLQVLYVARVKASARLNWSKEVQLECDEAHPSYVKLLSLEVAEESLSHLWVQANQACHLDRCFLITDISQLFRSLVHDQQGALALLQGDLSSHNTAENTNRYLDF